MRILTRLSFAVLAAWAFTACSATDEGSGTRTLLVDANVAYDARENLSLVEVLVNRGDKPVSGADVVFESDDGDLVRVPEDPIEPGRYRKNVTGYSDVLTLTVRHNADELTGTLAGPGPHVIKRPGNEYNLDSFAETTLQVEWDVYEGDDADMVVVQTKKYRTTFETDPGKIELDVRDLEPGKESVSVHRTSQVELKGGAPGSKLSMSYATRNLVNVN